MATTNDILEIFNLDDSNVNLDLNAKKESEYYNPKPEGKETYSAIIRFLPIPIKENGKLIGVESEPFYMKKRYYLRDSNGVGYYFDSPSTVGERCPISASYFRLKNSQNVLDKKRAGELKLNTHFWSLVYIIDDKKHPELNGKTKIFRFTADIQEKIKNEWDKRKVKVWDPFRGKDFDITVTNKKVTLDDGSNREFQDYTKSEFLDISPLTYKGKTLDKKDKEASAVINEMYSVIPDIASIKYQPWTSEEKTLLDSILNRYKSKDDVTSQEQTNKPFGSAVVSKEVDVSEDYDEADAIMRSLDI